MISDPIDGMDIPNAFQTSIGGKGIFYTIRLADANSDSLWSIAMWNRGALGITKKYWWAGNVNNPIKAEQFVSLMFKFYPDYAEWFLFHPEWL